MKKRLVSLVLSLVMIVTILPANCFAAGVSCAYGSTCAAHAAEVNGLHYDTIDEAIKAAKDGDTVHILKENDETVPVTIRDKSITILGNGHTDISRPISHTFIIKHTKGGHTVTFDNMHWVLDNNSAIQDLSVCSGENDVNTLNITNSLIYVNAENKENLPVVGIFGNTNKTTGITASGTKLVMTNDEIKTMHYNKGDVESDVDTYFNGMAMGAAIAMNCLYTNNYKFDMDADVYHYAKAEISKCKINGYFKYAFIGGYADLLDNSIRMSYYSSYSTKNMGKDCLKICGASSKNNGGQCDVVVAGDKFYNISGNLVTVANVDGDVAASPKSQILITGGDNGLTQNGIYYKKNTFDEVETLVKYDPTGTAMSVKFSSDLMTKNWDGIKNSEVGIYIGNIPFKKYGTIESDYMLTDSGQLAKTYTQMPIDTEHRTGFYYDFKGRRLWYLCNYGKNCYLVTDNDNNIYATYVADSGITNEFNDMRTTLVPTSLANAEVLPSEAGVLEGNLYSLGYRATVLDGNTYRNAIIEKKDNETYIISADTSRNLTDYDIVVYLSDDGGNRTTYLTYDEYENIESNSVRVVMPEINLTKVAYAGTRDINVSANISNLELDGQCTANILGIATIDKVNVNAMARLNNNGTVNNVIVGHTDTKDLVREDIQELSLGAVIQNNKTMGSVTLNTAANVYNGKKNYNVINKDATIKNITIGNPFASKIVDGSTSFFANGSVVENYGTINSGTINLFTQTVFENSGNIIDSSINFGYLGKNDDHSGTEFNNDGNIKNASFTIYGSSADKQFADTKISRPVISGYNSGSITGTITTPVATQQPLHTFLTSNKSNSIDIFSEEMEFIYPEYVNGDHNEFEIKAASGTTGWTMTCDDKTVTVTKTEDGYHVTNMPTEAATVVFRIKVQTSDLVVPIEVLVRATPEYEVPTNIKAKYNTYLEDVVLPEGFSWMDDGESVGELGTKIFLAKFTPEDLDNYHIVTDIEIEVEVVKGTPEYETPTLGQMKYGTKLDEIDLPTGFFWEESNEKDVGNEGTNTLYVYFIPEDETRFEQVHNIPVVIDVTHNYGRRTHTCDYCGRVDPETNLDQKNTKLKIKNYSKIVAGEIIEDYPDFASFVNVLVNASKGKNNLTDPSGFGIYDVDVTFKSNGKRVQVDESNFPLENINLEFAYSEIGSNDTYNFTIVGIKKDGSLFYPQVIKGEKGITFAVDTISPVLVSYYADENTVIEKTKTSVSTIIWITLFILVFAVLVLVFLKKHSAKENVENVVPTESFTDKLSLKEKVKMKADIIKQKAQELKNKKQ